MLKSIVLPALIVVTLGPVNMPPKTDILTQAQTASIASWQLPFNSPHRLVRTYLQPTSDYSAGHRGVDYEITENEQLYAPADGVIAVAMKVVDRPVLTIRHGASLVTELEPACATVKVGQIVSRGEKIATVCAPESPYKSHCREQLCLHFSLRSDGKYLSPLALIGGLSPSRLLPYALG